MLINSFPIKIFSRCGDGGPATEARLSFPKGLAVGVDKSVYISDGKSVRRVQQSGKIDTVIGGHPPGARHLLPIGCDTSYAVSEARARGGVIKSDIKQRSMVHNLVA